MFDPAHDYYTLDHTQLPPNTVWYVDTPYVREFWVVWGGKRWCQMVLLKDAYWEALGLGPDAA